MALQNGDCRHCGCPGHRHWPGPPKASTSGCMVHRHCDHYSPATVKPLPWDEVLRRLDRLRTAGEGE